MHLFYFCRVGSMTVIAQNIQKARRIDSYFVMMSLCLNISLQQLSKPKYFWIFICIFPTLSKTWGESGQNAGCYTRIHLQLEGKNHTSALHFEQLHPELRGSQAISGLSLMCSILTHHRIKQHYWRLKCTAVICSYRCTYYRCLNAFVKLP